MLLQEGPDLNPPDSLEEADPFVQLPAPRVSYLLLVRVTSFVCLSLEILLGAVHIIRSGSGDPGGWILAAMFGILLGWGDFMLAFYYRSNLLRMITTQAYMIMAACLLIAKLTGGRWAVSWVVPAMFLLLIIATFIAAGAQKMELHEYILYPAFDVLVSLLQIIPIALGSNHFIAPAVLSIAFMLILVSSLVIFRGRMLRDAAMKYLHL